MKEEAITFGGFTSLIGILTRPATDFTANRAPAVVLLNPGIVHRVGPGRIYVRIARTLASLGFPVVRFDFSGIGDSPVRNDHLPFEKSAIRETEALMDFVEAEHGISQFILMGGCSGARIALQTASLDSRVLGTIPINFPLTDEEDDSNPDLVARRMAHYYWTSAMHSAHSWIKLLKGDANYRNLVRAIWCRVRQHLRRSEVHSPESVQLIDNLQTLSARNRRTAFIYSSSDPRLGELREALGRRLKQLRRSGKVTLNVIPRTDHTFSSLEDQQLLLTAITEIVRAMSLPSEALGWHPAPARITSHKQPATC